MSALSCHVEVPEHSSTRRLFTHRSVSAFYSVPYLAPQPHTNNMSSNLSTTTPADAQAAASVARQPPTTVTKSQESSIWTVWPKRLPQLTTTRTRVSDQTFRKRKTRVISSQAWRQLQACLFHCLDMLEKMSESEQRVDEGRLLIHSCFPNHNRFIC